MKRKPIIDKAQVIIPGSIDTPPEPHEIASAQILARHYNTVVEFIKPNISYKIKSPDFKMNNISWELKCPTGNSKKHTIKDQFERSKGKHHLIINGQYTPLTDDHIIGRFGFELEKHKDIRRLIYITKEQKVLEIK
jgi:hypothetical protein